MKILRRILLWFVVVLALIAAALPMAGQLGLLRGTPPTDLGVKDGRLKPPSLTPNSVSSQADLYPDHPQRGYASIAPLQVSGTAHMPALAAAVQALGNCKPVRQDNSYLFAECSTLWLGFVDDLELWDNTAQQRVEVRSASRLGRKDMGVNRARVEALRAILLAQPAG